LAEQKRNAERFAELRKKDTLTDEEIVESRAIVDGAQDLKDKIKAEERAAEYERSLDDSINGGAPEGGDPTANNETNITVEDKPIYRSFEEQIYDVIVDETAHHNKRAFTDKEIKECRGRMEKSEKRMNETRAAGSGQIVGSGQDGGIAVQTDFATDIIDHGFNNEALTSKTAKRTITTGADSIKINSIDESSRVSGSRYGGIRVYTTAELEELTPSKGKFTKIELKLNKLTGLNYQSEEMWQDAAFAAQEIVDLFPKEFAYVIQGLIFEGSGSGEPLGIMNANALIQVDEDSGQTAGTITRKNLVNMIARNTSSSAEWYANKDTLPQLAELVEVTTLKPLLVMNTVNSGTLMNIPITFIEQANTLGSVGDISLLDMGQYLTISKGGIRKDQSLEVKFEFDQRAIRWIYRMDGQSRWKNAITPAKGTATTSPFTTIEART
ncbi:MAG: phage major capsid protein, partial [Bacteroidetes bacterium]|nr:phage major capsid protein [Bacteroidota bacterium]